MNRFPGVSYPFQTTRDAIAQDVNPQYTWLLPKATIHHSQPIAQLPPTPPIRCNRSPLPLSYL
jgi:hypothetical protein